jgi:hypothetical protein
MLSDVDHRPAAPMRSAASHGQAAARDPLGNGADQHGLGSRHHFEIAADDVAPLGEAAGHRHLAECIHHVDHLLEEGQEEPGVVSRVQLDRHPTPVRLARHLGEALDEGTHRLGQAREAVLAPRLDDAIGGVGSRPVPRVARRRRARGTPRHALPRVRAAGAAAEGWRGHTGIAVRVPSGGVRQLLRSAVALAVPAALLAACGTTPPAVTAASARSQVSRAYRTLFDLSDKSVKVKLGVVQDGPTIRRAMTEALASPLAATAAGAAVHQVTLLGRPACQNALEPWPCAKVVYDILATNGSTLEAGSAGYAVYVDGRWLVAKSTVCSLFELLYTTENKAGTPPGC